MGTLSVLTNKRRVSTTLIGITPQDWLESYRPQEIDPSTLEKHRRMRKVSTGILFFPPLSFLHPSGGSFHLEFGMEEIPSMHEDGNVIFLFCPFVFPVLLGGP